MDILRNVQESRDTGRDHLHQIAACMQTFRFELLLTVIEDKTVIEIGN